jgi:hypothetical protein
MSAPDDGRELADALSGQVVDRTGWEKLDTTRPNIARVYDYWLGGKDNYAADREEAERLLAVYPLMAKLARDNRQFLTRAVTWVAGQGVRQFLDIGSGLPTAQNTHQAAQAADESCRVVYADNDPVVLTHARALLAGPGVEAIEGDLRDPMGILGAPEVCKMIRPDEPACVVLALVLHFFDFEHAWQIAGAFTSWLPAGSYLILSVGSGDEETGGALTRAYTAAPLDNHSPAQIAAFFSGLDLTSPGLVDARDWRPGWREYHRKHQGGRILAGVARKPDVR